MDESKTSITEDIHRQMHTEPWSVCYEIMLEHARELEREIISLREQLAAAMTALKAVNADQEWDYLGGDAQELVSIALAREQKEEG